MVDRINKAAIYIPTSPHECQLRPMAQCVSSFQSRCQRPIRVGCKAIQVTHLAPGPGLRFSIEMQSNAGSLERLFPAWLTLRPEIAEQVDHRHRREQPGLGER